MKPLHKAVLAFALPLLAILLVYRGVIFGGGIFANQDVIYNYLPYYLDLVRGTFVDHGLLGGFPVYTTMQATWFSPMTRALLAYLRPENAYIFADLLYVVLTYVCAYLYARKIGMRNATGIIVSMTYLFGGQVMLWSHTPLITLYHFMLPALLWLFEVMKSAKHRWLKVALTILMGCIGGFGWISGHVQFNVYVHTFFFVYAFWSYVVWSIDKKRGLIRLAMFAAAVCSISFAIGLPQIDAVLAVQPLTFRALGVTVAQLYGLGYMPYTIIQYILPSFRIFYPPVAQSFQNYVGIVALFVFAVWHLGLSRKLPKIADRKYYFFTGVFLFCLIIAINKSPLAMLTHFVPLYKSFRESVRLMFIGDFALAIAVGYMLEAILSSRADYVREALTKPLVWLRRFAVAAALFFAAMTVVKVFFFARIEKALVDYFIAHKLASTTGGLPIEHYSHLIHIYLDRDLVQLTYYSFHVIALVVVLGLVYLTFKRVGKWAPDRIAFALVVIVALDFSAAYYDRFPVVDKNRLYTPSKTELAILDNEKKQGSTAEFRYQSVFGNMALWLESVRCTFPDLNNWNISQAEFDLRKELVDPNFNLYGSLQAADGYEPFMLRHVSDVAGYTGSRLTSSSDEDDIVGMPTLKLKLSALVDRKNVLRAQNIKYLVSPYEISDPDFTQIAREEVGACKTPMLTYELSHPYPRYFLTNNVVSAPIDFKPNMLALKQSAKPVILIHSASTTAPTNDASKTTALTPTYNGNSIFFALPAGLKKTTMGIGLTWSPSWHAKIDDRDAAVLRANYSQMALEIPEAAKKVEIYYSPEHYFKLLR